MTARTLEGPLAMSPVSVDVRNLRYRIPNASFCRAAVVAQATRDDVRTSERGADAWRRR